MPRIPTQMLDAVVYLYPSKMDAVAGTNFGGSGFLVGWDIAGTNRTLAYVVTNWHIALQGSPVVRVNTIGGGHDIFEFDELDWVFDPHYDCAIHPITLNSEIHQFAYLSFDAFVTEKQVQEQKIGPGDDVFMIGRFVDHDGGPFNLPAARFGNISINPTPIVQPNGARAKSYCLDMHSRSGYSGSPVFIYRTPGYDLERGISADPKERKLLVSGTNFLMLLGIHYAQFPELWEVSDTGQLIRKESKEPLLTDGKYIRGLSGMTCVLPAWNIMEVLNLPKVKKHREELGAIVRDRLAKNASEPTAESASPGDEANPNHREDFMRLVGAAAKTPQSKE